MAAYDIRIIGDPILNSRVADVEDIDGSLVRLVDDMLVTMYDAPGLSLAANQIGVQKRLFVWDVGEGPQVIVNPQMTEFDGEWEFEEGCLSVPDDTATVERDAQLTLKGQDRDGNPIEERAEGVRAVCIQHEIDHLDGILFIDRISRLKRSLYVKKRKKQLAAED